MLGSAAFHDLSGAERVLQRRPLVLTASGPFRRGLASFWIGPLRVRLLEAAPAGSTVLSAAYDFDLPASGELLTRGRRYGYQLAADGRILLDRPLEAPLAAGARPSLVLDSSLQPPFLLLPSGSDASQGEFTLRIRAAGQDSYLPAAAGFLQPAYAGGADGLVLACGFRGSLEDWSGRGLALFQQGPASGFLRDGAAAGSGAIDLSAQGRVVWSFLGESLQEGAAELWFRPAAAGPLLGMDGTDWDLSVETAPDGRLRVLAGGQPLAETQGQIRPGQWNFLCLAWDNGQAELLLNGRPGAVFSLPPDSFQAPFDLALEPGCGLVDEFRLFRRRLPLAAFGAHWNDGAGCGLTDDYLPGLRIDLLLEAVAGGEAFWRQLVLGWSCGSWSFPLPVEAARLAAEGRFRLTIFPAQAERRHDAGFLIGEHRWPAGSGPADAVPLVPTRWDADVRAIGVDRFSSGVARGHDLEPLGTVRQDHSILLRMRPGFFFSGPERHYYPAGDGFRIVRYSSDGEEGEIRLGAALRPQTPVLARTYRMDEAGRFQIDADFRQRPAFSEQDGVRELVVADRSSGRLRLRGRLQPATELLGRAPAQVAPEGQLVWFQLPVYPVWSLQSVRTEHGQAVAVAEFDRDNGRVRLRIEASMAGADLRMEYEPALLVTFEPDGAAEELLAPGIDLNPSASGLATGYVVLANRRSRIERITLFCDKPRLLFSHSPAAQTPMVVFGPVYYGSDFAILMAQAFGAGQDPVANVELRFHALPGFQGLLRYADPMAPGARLTATTNGEGMAWMLYTPPPVYGFYLHPSMASWNGRLLRLELPADSEIYLQQLYGQPFGWRARLYFVRNNHPYLGKVGANIAAGEVPWTEFGNVGTSHYRTNGLRELQMTSGGVPVAPVQVYDSQNRPGIAGQGQENPDFSGPVRAIEFEFPDEDSNGQPDASLDHLGAYFLSLIGLIGLWAEDPVSGIRSNTIYLQLDMAPEVVDQPPVSGYLHLNDPERGRVNLHRLGGGPLPRFVIAIPKL